MKITKKTVVSVSSALLLLALVAWSPPGNDTIVLGSTSMTTSGSLLVVGSGSTGKAQKAIVVGSNHALGTNNRSGSIVAGTGNTVDASTTLVSGSNNLAEGVGSLQMRNSCIIGGANEAQAEHAYVFGYNNAVEGDYGSALGYGLQIGATTEKAVALGRWNEETETNDVLVVGTGASAAAPATALRITDDGSVILGRAQGDISMGIYGN